MKKKIDPLVKTFGEALFQAGVTRVSDVLLDLVSQGVTGYIKRTIERGREVEKEQHGRND